ncbi:MAG: hypothetical protein L6Q78_09525 [Bacteroidia bacterium]|nr:hypothetical protein [Bacteroidia bacterium]
MLPFWETRILLVETNETTIRLIEKTLSESRIPHFLRWVRNQKDLEFELRFNQPDILITGRNMQGFDAMDIIREVKKANLSITTLVIAGDRNQEKDIPLALAGVYEIFPINELKYLVKEIGFLADQIRETKLQA